MNVGDGDLASAAGAAVAARRGKYSPAALAAVASALERMGYPLELPPAE